VCPVFHQETSTIIAFQLLSPRLHIREFVEEDAGFVLALLNDPAFIRYIGDRKVRCLDDAIGYLASGPISSYREHGYGLWLVELAETRLPIGMAGLLNRETLDHCDIGYALLADYRGMGYAFEATTAVLDFASQALEMDTLLAIVSSENHDSKKLLYRHGFMFQHLGAVTPDGNEVEVFELSLHNRKQSTAGI
jgi:RimJ/RimL family protein N-acetyltransferase